jgi:hypothetical protein
MNQRKAKALRRDVLRAALSSGESLETTYQDVPKKRIVYQGKDEQGNVTVREELRTQRVHTDWKAAYRFLKKMYKTLNKRDRRGVR